MTATGLPSTASLLFRSGAMRPTPHLLRPISPKRRNIDFAISAGLVLAIVLFVLLGLLLLWTTREQITAGRAVSQGNQVLAGVRAISANLETATATQRAYLLTGDTAYLIPSRAATERAVSGAREAGRLTADNIAQQQRLDTLDALLAVQLNEMRRLTAIRAEYGLPAAITAFQRPKANLMPVIRKLLGDMDAEERRLLDRRRRRERSVTSGASVATVLAVVSAIILAAFAAAALRRYIADRRAVDQMKNDLVGVVAHEVRSPLTAIHGALALMRAGEPLDTRRDRLVTMASANADRLLRLVNTMLDLEKIESGKLDLHYEVFTVDVAVEAALSGVAPLATAAGVLLEREGFFDVAITADRDRLVQVLTNLASNAIRFSPPGATVRVAARREGASIRFEVLDRGPGVPPDRASRLFGKFEQLHDGVRGGTGLGLAISRAIALDHGGEMGYTPRDGGGSMFWVRIPVEKTTA